MDLPMKITVLKEAVGGEKRVALVPETVAKLVKAGFAVAVEPGAGAAAGFTDAEYAAKGAEVGGTAATLVPAADVLLAVRAPSDAVVGALRSGTVVIGMLAPFQNAEVLKRLADRGASAFSLELLPRITRAQSMDVLSSQSSLAGYRCVIEAAMRLPKIFAMMMTAAGTLSPARVFILGAGVAGLQAIATARRLGAVVEAYDVRPAVKEEVQSLGARFVELPIETKDLADSGGYAKAQGEEFLKKQRELMQKHVSQADVVITTALIPGRKAPVLVTEEMVQAMKPGTVLIDLAAEQGGNCPLSRAGEDVIVGGVTIVGMKDVLSGVAQHASIAYSRNLASFLASLAPKEPVVTIDVADELVAATLVTHEGRVRFGAAEGK